MSGSTPKTQKVASPEAQAQANIDTARYQSVLDRPQQYTPLGSNLWYGPPEAQTNIISLSPEMQNQLQGGQGIAAALIPQIQGNLPGSSQPGWFDPTMGGQQFSDTANQAANAAYGQATGYLDPQFQQAQEQQVQDLANRGIPIDSEAYATATGNFARQKQSAYESARNAAFNQGLAAQNQGFTQGLQGLQTQFAQQQMPMQALGQILNLETGGQYQPYQYNAPQIQPVNFGAAAQTTATQPNPWLSVLGSGLGAAGMGAGLAFSDRRLKHCIVPLGIELGGCKLYSFASIFDDIPRVGVMYDEVAKINPRAACKIGGIGFVDYERLVA